MSALADVITIGSLLETIEVHGDITRYRVGEFVVGPSRIIKGCGPFAAEGLPIFGRPAIAVLGVGNAGSVDVGIRPGAALEGLGEILGHVGWDFDVTEDEVVPRLGKDRTIGEDVAAF